jgi:cytochrome b6-f complex iron-sulfur subunit
MSSAQKNGRRHFLLSSVGLGALLGLPKLASGAGGTKVAISLAKLPVLESTGGSIVIKVKDKLLLLVRDSPTSMRALNPVCTHRHCVVGYKSSEQKIKCPCHGSEFDLNGHVIKGPAPRPLEAYAAVLAENQVIVTL